MKFRRFLRDNYKGYLFVLPLILGIVLLVNPFRAAKAAIMFFGISILADGLFELITYIQQRRAEKSEYKDIR